MNKKVNTILSKVAGFPEVLEVKLANMRPPGDLRKNLGAAERDNKEAIGYIADAENAAKLATSNIVHGRDICIDLIAESKDAIRQLQEAIKAVKDIPGATAPIDKIKAKYIEVGREASALLSAINSKTVNLKIPSK